MLCLGLMKTENRNISVLNGCRSILGLFWVKFQSAFELGLVLRKFCIKEMLGLKRRCCQNFPKPMFCFGYNLAITYPN